jgi:uncharacterized membrane protein YdjX (TVP38/TMEM64 family)
MAEPSNRALNAAIFGGLILLLGFFAYSLLSGGIFYSILSPELDSAQKLELLKAYFESFGWAAPAIYVLFVATEVIVAPIPGLMLYAPGGAIFGGFWGGLFALIGNVIGAGVACFLGTRLFPDLSEDDNPAEDSKVEKIARTLRANGLWVVFLLRLNPLTSSDLVSYAAGAIRMPISRVVFATGLGMAPQCWAQSYLAESIFAWVPQLLYVFLAMCLVYFAAASYVLLKSLRKREATA